VEIAQEICDTRAHTLAGIMVKVRMVESLALDDKSDAWDSVAADIRLLAGQQ
jgi:hypothetical protein